MENDRETTVLQSWKVLTLFLPRFQRRQDAADARTDLDGATLEGCRIKVGWGKSLDAKRPAAQLIPGVPVLRAIAPPPVEATRRDATAAPSLAARAAAAQAEAAVRALLATKKKRGDNDTAPERTMRDDDARVEVSRPADRAGTGSFDVASTWVFSKRCPRDKHPRLGFAPRDDRSSKNEPNRVENDRDTRFYKVGQRLTRFLPRPADREQREVIDRLAEFVAVDGVELENAVRDREAKNPLFAFLRTKTAESRAGKG